MANKPSDGLFASTMCRVQSVWIRENRRTVQKKMKKVAFEVIDFTFSNFFCNYILLFRKKEVLLRLNLKNNRVGIEK